MSRPIRYRAWDKKSKEYRIVKNIAFDYNGDIDFVVTVDKDTGQDPWDQTLDEIVLEQDTGLKDDNCKNVFEGDIVTLAGETGVVERRSGSYFVVANDGMLTIMAGWKITKLKVIGNVHKNPELLGGEE